MPPAELVKIFGDDTLPISCGNLWPGTINPASHPFARCHRARMADISVIRPSEVVYTYTNIFNAVNFQFGEPPRLHSGYSIVAQPPRHHFRDIR
jgi:hypothetical protein